MRSSAFSDIDFRFQYDNGGGLFSDMTFEHCSFVGCAFSVVSDPAARSVARNLTMRDCEVRGSTIDGAIVEQVRIDSLRTHTLLQSWAAVFRHVTLRGRIGRIMLSHRAQSGSASPEVQQAFDEANAAYYSGVDWALDITEAEFTEADLRGVPADLVLRDPVTQAVVRREKVLDGRWRTLDLSKTWWQTSIEFMLADGRADVVLVAPKRHRSFRDALAGIELLRTEGIADPD